MIMICLVNYFFEKLHANIFQDVEIIEVQALNERIDQYISANYEKVNPNSNPNNNYLFIQYLEEFQNLYLIFKNDLINIKRIKDFMTYLKLDEVIQNENIDIFR